MNSIDADMTSEIGSSRGAVNELSPEVPYQGGWRSGQTYPTWAPRGCLPF